MNNLEFMFDSRYFGKYNSVFGIRISLPAHQQTYGRNENKLIDKICFTINHEAIHAGQDKVKELNHIKNHCEIQNYYMIGDGGNTCFLPYYNIKKDEKWWS